MTDIEEADEVTLEQGRQHLRLLSKEFQEQKATDHSVGSSNRLNLQIERKLLDQKPRGDRLKNRKGSPLGLTLEELDDRGLLDGGGVVPSYYRSLKQKQRRYLELQRRSSRLKQRGQDDDCKSYTLESLICMLRILIRKGINFEDYFQSIDRSGSGVILKENFITVVKEFGLPFATKELAGFAQKFSVSDEHMDYEAFLQEVVSNDDQAVDSANRYEGSRSQLVGETCRKTLRNMYNMIYESTARLAKTTDDIYRMFSRWDYDGCRAVTSTQFFRVLSLLHVTFSDQDQDFIVELLDTNNEGKINFDALLNYCFCSWSHDDLAHECGVGSHQQQNSEGGDVSVVSIDGGSFACGTISAADVRSVTSGNLAKRPHTAAAFRRNFVEHDEKLDDFDSYMNSDGVNSPIGNYEFLQSPPLKTVERRPLTAFARVVHNSCDRHVNSVERSDKLLDDGQNFIHDVSSGSDDEDCVIHRNEYMKHCSTDQGSNIESLMNYNRNKTHHDMSADIATNVENEKMRDEVTTRYTVVNGESQNYLTYICNVLATLRKAIVFRVNQQGLNIQEVFDVFDKRCMRYIDAGDFMKSCAEFKIDISYATSKSAVGKIALDGSDKISFSDFAVWVTDPEYEVLERNVQHQLADHLEQQGREYQYMIYRFLSESGTSESGALRSKNKTSSPGLVSVHEFTVFLKTLGLNLPDVDVDRIVLKFDTHGTGQCSVSRFVRMFQSSSCWKAALETLTYHEEAVEEAEVVRQRKRSTHRRAISTNLDDDVLDMAEYLGIRVLSEPHLLWIVHDAIMAPLPDDWTIHQDKDGRTFFYNSTTQSTRWDHPLDPEFRKLRDYHRKHNVDQAELYDSRRESRKLGKYPASNEANETCRHAEWQQKNDMLPDFTRKAVSNKEKYHYNYLQSPVENIQTNTILLYNKPAPPPKKKKSIGIICGNYSTKKNQSKYDKRRSVSAGRIRKRTGRDMSASDRHKALNHMLGDNIIEELDLALRGNDKTPLNKGPEQTRKSQGGRTQTASGKIMFHVDDSTSVDQPREKKIYSRNTTTVWL